MNDDRTIWHITFGTYGTRLHGGERPTVGRKDNRRGTPFLDSEPRLEAFEQRSLRAGAAALTPREQGFIEAGLPELCRRGGWGFRACAAGTDHVHLLCDVPQDVHGKQVRTLVKRWLTQELTAHFGKGHRARWWARGGSTKPVKDAAYLANVLSYIERQRRT